jgi:hypothetical protein
MSTPVGLGESEYRSSGGILNDDLAGQAFSQECFNQNARLSNSVTPELLQLLNSVFCFQRLNFSSSLNVSSTFLCMV